MSIRNLDAVFHPKSVALIGASNRPGSVGFVVARNLLAGGFEGPIMPVNPAHPSVAGMLAYPDVASLPMTPDLAVICTPPQTVPGLIADLGKRGTKGAVVITAGFNELGTDEGTALEQAMLDAAKPHIDAHRGAELPGRPVHGGRPQRLLRAGGGEEGRRRLRRAVRRDADDDPGLGERARHRLFASGLAGRHDRCRFRRHARLSRHRSEHPFHPALYRDHHPCAQIHVGGARGGAAETRDRHQGRPPRRCGQGGELAHRRHGRRRCGLRRRLPARRHSAGEGSGRSVRRGRDAGDAGEAGRRPAHHRHQWRRARRAGDRRAARPRRRHGAAVRQPPWQSSTRCLPATWSHGNPVDIIGDATPKRYADACAALLETPATDSILVLNCPVAVASSIDAAKAVARRG